jgi:hypothetical protein
MKHKKELTKIMDPIVHVEAQVGLSEIAAIKVAHEERALLIEQSQLRSDIKKAEAETPGMEAALQEAAIKDTMKNYPEFSEIEKMLTGLCKSYCLTISIGSDGKVLVSLNAGGSIAWKGDKSKALSSELAAHKTDLDKMIDRLAETKRQIGNMDYIGRQTTADVAKHKLSKTEEGREILAMISKITLPALPGPK